MTSAERRRSYGRAIREQRELRSMTLNDLAGLLSVSRSALSRYEKGEVALPEVLQHSVALIFGVDVDRLFPLGRVDDGLARSA